MLDRNDLSLRRKTHDSTSLSEEQMGAIHFDFVVNIRNLIDLHQFIPQLQINMDETGCHFDMAPSTSHLTKAVRSSLSGL
jgi:hypothetical protein